MNSGAYNEETLVQFAAFRDHGLGVGCCVYKLTEFYLTKLIELFQRCVISTVKDLRKIFGHAVRALTYIFQQFMQNFKFHAPLQRFVWCISDSVPQFLTT